MKARRDAEIHRLDSVWTIEYPTPGQRLDVIKIDWNVELPDGSRLTDDRHELVRGELQEFITSAIETPQSGLRMAPGSIPATFNALKELAGFMINEGQSSFSDLTSAKSWSYVDFIERNYEESQPERGRRRELTHASAYRLLHPLIQIFGQRRVMGKAGFGVMPEEPFDGRSTYDVVTKELGLLKSGKLLPLPDDVATPILCHAFDQIILGACDIITLQEQVIEIIETTPRNRSFKEVRELLVSHQFATNPRTGLSWRGPIEATGRVMIDGREVDLLVFQSFRRAIQMLMVACTVCIQGCTGMRAHEIIGLDGGVDQETGLPACIKIKKSTDGLMEIFFITGKSAKRELRDAEWLAGTRPVGSDSMPIPIAALAVLEKLLDPWRRMKGGKKLLLTFKTSKGLPNSAASIGKLSAPTLTVLQKEFAELALISHGDSPEIARSKAMKVRGHRWRSTFANYVFRTNPKLLAPLKDHFHHLSELITDVGYVGNDASLLEDLNGERVQFTAEALLAVSLGRKIGAGNVQRLIDKYGADLRAEIERQSGETPLDKAKAFVELHDIRIWNGTYAACWMSFDPASSKCNDVSKVPVPVRSGPDYGLRSPGMCVGCKCSLILPDHREYWERRMQSNLELVEAYASDGPGWGFREIAQRRVNQSRSILDALNRSSSSGTEQHLDPANS